MTRAVPAPGAGVHRVARDVEVFAFWPPRSGLPRAEGPVEGGNRWDDPEGRFPTVYCASSAEGAFGEVIARYRDSGVTARIEAWLSEAPDPAYDPPLEPARVPDDFFVNRWVGQIAVDPEARFIDVDDPATHRAVGAGLRARLRPLGVTRVDRAAFLSPDRRVTRTIAGHFHDLAETPDHASWRGLRYASRLAPDWECWAVWAPSPLLASHLEVAKVTRRHPALLGAAERLGIAL